MQTSVLSLLPSVFVNKEIETYKLFPELLIYPMQYRPTRGPLSLVSTTEELLSRKVAAPV
jgi:hypothetical protein